MLHTGDISHLRSPTNSTPWTRFERRQSGRYFLRSRRARRAQRQRQTFLERFGRTRKGKGWYSFDQKGVHFIGLVNVVSLKAGGLGNLGAEQLEWIETRRRAI